MSNKLLIDAKHEINSKIGLTGQILIHTESAYNYFIKNLVHIKEYVDELCVGISNHYCSKLENLINIEREKIKLVIIEPGKYRFEKNYDYSFRLLNKYSSYMWRCILSPNINELCSFFNAINHGMYIESGMVFNLVQKGYDINRACFNELWLWRCDMKLYFNGITLTNDDKIFVKPKVINIDAHHKTYYSKQKNNYEVKSPVYFVMGMHRSGTSLIAQKLHLFGIEMGNKLLGVHTPKLSDNLKGHYEDIDAININNCILNIDSNFEDNTNWLYGKLCKVNDGNNFNAKINEFLVNYKDKKNWAVKDPRHVLTFPYWFKKIKNLKLIVTLRNPISVARSLRNRDDICETEGINLWIKYYKIMIEILECYPVDYLLIDYDTIAEKEGSINSKLSKYVGMTNKKIPYNFSKELNHNLNEKKTYRSELKKYCNKNKREEINEIYQYFGNINTKNNVTRLAVIRCIDKEIIEVILLEEQLHVKKHISKNKIPLIDLKNYILSENIHELVIIYHDNNHDDNDINNILKYQNNHFYKYTDDRFKLNKSIRESITEQFGLAFSLSLDDYLTTAALKIPASFYLRQEISSGGQLLNLIRKIESYGIEVESCDCVFEINVLENLKSKIDKNISSFKDKIKENDFPISYSKLELFIKNHEGENFSNIIELNEKLTKFFKFNETKEYAQLFTKYIERCFVTHLIDNKLYYKKFLEPSLNSNLSTLSHTQGLWLTKTKKQLERNKVQLDKLVGENCNKDVVIIGTSPSLLEVDCNKLSEFCKDKVSISLNEAYLKYEPNIMMSAYITRILWAAENLKNTNATVLYCKGQVDIPDIENSLYVLRQMYNGNLNKRFDEVPTLQTINNIALMASSFAFILNTKNIYYLGVDLDSDLHFFDIDIHYNKQYNNLKNTKYYKQNSSIAGYDHHYDTYYVSNNLEPTISEAKVSRKVNSFSYNTVLESFRIYKKHFDENNIKCHILNRNSNLKHLSFKYHQL